MRLWHFTCEHGYAGLKRAGVLVPNLHPLLPAFTRGLVWLTEEEAPGRDDVGLTSETLQCDRMAYRYLVHPAPPSCVRWSDVRHRADPRALQMMEAFGKPETWWISELPLGARLNVLDRVPA